MPTGVDAAVTSLSIYIVLIASLGSICYCFGVAGDPVDAGTRVVHDCMHALPMHAASLRCCARIASTQMTWLLGVMNLAKRAWRCACTRER